MKEMLALHFFVYLFINQKYSAAMNEYVVLLKNAMEELLHHVSSSKGTGMDLLIEINNIASWDDDEYAKSSCKPSGAAGKGIAPQVEYYLGPLTDSLNLSSSDKYMDVRGSLYTSEGFSGMSSDIDFLFPMILLGYTEVNIKSRNEQYGIKVKQVPSKFNHMLEANKVSLNELVFTAMALICLAILDPIIAGGEFLGSHVEGLVTLVFLVLHITTIFKSSTQCHFIKLAYTYSFLHKDQLK
ncbi:hypothetical protein A4A49_12779 [Nicotiana attenuata]|uniref:Uncharacterized protein n=1 Tax=Nicotiana attenuata TaxID=49451 RepID=A0A1J6I8X2_NICAT|nr:hypothetical protein A4A49_12779 [Nicotiana attenuata]